MTNSFRKLITRMANELDEYQRMLLDDRTVTHWLSDEARAALAEADEPAVPQGREPAAVTGQPSDEELYDYWLSTSPELGCDAVRFALAVLARWGNPAPAPPADVSQLSDGYHTFAELYEHRHSLMLALMRAQPQICWFSRRHADGELPFGSDDWFIVGAELPGAPITYHLPAALYSLAQKTGATELPTGRPWDGHTAADVVQRLRDWAIEPASPADGEVAELVEWLEGEADHYTCIGFEDSAAKCARAAELLQRQVLVPVSVSERWPGPEDCDAEGRCWFYRPKTQILNSYWDLVKQDYGDMNIDPVPPTHWLPAHALPLPEVGE